MATRRLALRFEDTSRTQAECGLWLDENLSIPQVQSAANLLRSVALPLTTASLVDAIWRYDVDFSDTPPASPDSDCRVRMLFFFRDSERCRAISVPSPALLPLDTTGPYRGVRLQRSSFLLHPLYSALQVIAGNTVDEVGRQFPTNYTVGGRTRL